MKQPYRLHGLEYNLAGGRDESGPLSGGGCGVTARLPPIFTDLFSFTPPMNSP
ncbi:MAG: hypothetical protein LUQ02_00835 [Methanothrix sp.]|nr:hypothetical protein [Methanothrix sp.]